MAKICCSIRSSPVMNSLNILILTKFRLITFWFLMVMAITSPKWKPLGKGTGAKVISNFEIVSWFEQKGLQGPSYESRGKWSFDFGTVKYVNAIHSSVLPDGTYGGNPGGFVIWDDNNCFYFAGDTAVTMDMKLIPMLCPKLDFAIMPIGDNFTMDIQEACMAADFVACKKIVGCHYDTFGYIVIDKDAAKKAFEDTGKELILLPVGESADV